MKMISARVSPLHTGGYVKNVSLYGNVDSYGVFFGPVTVTTSTRREAQILNFEEIKKLHSEIISNILMHRERDSIEWLPELYEMKRALDTIKNGKSWVYPVYSHASVVDKIIIPSAPPQEELQNNLNPPPSYEEVTKEHRPNLDRAARSRSTQTSTVEEVEVDSISHRIKTIIKKIQAKVDDLLDSAVNSILK